MCEILDILKKVFKNQVTDLLLAVQLMVSLKKKNVEGKPSFKKIHFMKKFSKLVFIPLFF